MIKWNITSKNYFIEQNKDDRELLNLFKNICITRNH